MLLHPPQIFAAFGLEMTDVYLLLISSGNVSDGKVHHYEGFRVKLRRGTMLLLIACI